MEYDQRQTSVTLQLYTDPMSMHPAGAVHLANGCYQSCCRPGSSNTLDKKDHGNNFGIANESGVLLGLVKITRRSVGALVTVVIICLGVMSRSNHGHLIPKALRRQAHLEASPRPSSLLI